MIEPVVTENEVQKLYERLNKDTQASGCNLNRDFDFIKDLIHGLIVNQKRYGYQSCPCRIASGKKEDDLDIICPCDYRDDDLTEFGCCYCALYISDDIFKGNKKVTSIQERRPSPEQRKMKTDIKRTDKISSQPIPIWRCRVCGYLCARENPPEICPICKVKKERFERFV
jgi:ferredoxin-thioredoxin reductase catalytic subunit